MSISSGTGFQPGCSTLSGYRWRERFRRFGRAWTRYIESLKTRIKRAEAQIAAAIERGNLNAAHQKKRRLSILAGRLASVLFDKASGRVRLCFGSKKLWRKQYHLEANGYASHDEWREDWRAARS